MSKSTIARTSKNITQNIVVAAQSGDIQAMEKIIGAYGGYIYSLATMVHSSQNGQPSIQRADQDLLHDIEQRLRQYVTDFRPKGGFSND